MNQYGQQQQQQQQQQPPPPNWGPVNNGPPNSPMSGPGGKGGKFKFPFFKIYSDNQLKLSRLIFCSYRSTDVT